MVLLRNSDLCLVFSFPLSFSLLSLFLPIFAPKFLPTLIFLLFQIAGSSKRRFVYSHISNNRIVYTPSKLNCLWEMQTDISRVGFQIFVISPLTLICVCKWLRREPITPGDSLLWPPLSNDFFYLGQVYLGHCLANESSLLGLSRAEAIVIQQSYLSIQTPSFVPLITARYFH